MNWIIGMVLYVSALLAPEPEADLSFVINSITSDQIEHTAANNYLNGYTRAFEAALAPHGGTVVDVALLQRKLRPHVVPAYLHEFRNEQEKLARILLLPREQEMYAKVLQRWPEPLKRDGRVNPNITRADVADLDAEYGEASFELLMYSISNLRSGMVVAATNQAPQDGSAAQIPLDAPFMKDILQGEGILSFADEGQRDALLRQLTP